VPISDVGHDTFRWKRHIWRWSFWNLRQRLKQVYCFGSCL